MAGRGSTDDHNLFTALGHPIRRQILRAMSNDETKSPRELAERLGTPLGTLSYHVRVLARCGVLKLVHEEPVRGTMQHFYRSSLTAGWARSLLREVDGQAVHGGRRGEEIQ